MKKIPVIVIILMMLISVAIAGSRATIRGTEILDLGECTEDRKRCVVAEATHSRFGHLLQFIDDNKDGIPDNAYMFRMAQNPSDGRKGLVEGGGIRQSPKETRDIVLKACTKYNIDVNMCILYSDLFRGWEVGIWQI